MNKLNRKVTAADLIPCQITYQGNRYSPITHKQVIETIYEYLDKKNIKIKTENYLSASNGQRAIGRIAIDCGDLETGYELSFKNSLDGSMSFGICSGSVTFICSNGSVYGDVSSYKKKHSGNANEQILVELARVVDLMEDTMKTHIERRQIMKEREITKKTISELCGRMFIEEEIITANQLGIIKKELENPSFNYNSSGSVWEFYQHCTLATKETTPLLWHKTHQELSNFFISEFEILQNKEDLVSI
jgi:Domain of unknown function (DUF932)